MFSTLYAQASAPTNGQGGGFFVPFLIIILIAYFLILRPQFRRQKNLEKKKKALKKGDTVVTAGGIYGKVSHLKEDGRIISVDIAQGVKVDLLRSSISEVVLPNAPAGKNPNKFNKPKKHASSK